MNRLVERFPVVFLTVIVWAVSAHFMIADAAEKKPARRTGKAVVRVSFLDGLLAGKSTIAPNTVAQVRVPNSGNVQGSPQPGLPKSERRKDTPTEVGTEPRGSHVTNATEPGRAAAGSTAADAGSAQPGNRASRWNEPAASPSAGHRPDDRLSLLETGPPPSITENRDAEEIPPDPPAEDHDSASDSADKTLEQSDPKALLAQGKESADRERMQEALKSFQTAAKLAVRKNDQKLYAEALTEAGRLLHRLNRSEEALRDLRRAAKAHEAVKDSKAQAQDLLTAARILMEQGRFGSALKILDESEKALRDPLTGDGPAVLEETAQCMIRLQKLADAGRVFATLRSGYAKAGKIEDAARICLLLGEIEASQGQYKASLASFRKAEDSYRKLKRTKELGETLLRIAYAEKALGQLKEAEKSFQDAAVVLRDHQGPLDALPLMVQGMHAADRAGMIEAAQKLTEGMNLFDKTGNRIMAARARLALAHVEKDRARLESSLELGGIALKDFRALSAVDGEAGALLLIGQVYYLQGFVHKALEYAQECLAISKKVDERNQLALSRVLLVEIHTSLGDSDFAAKLLKEAWDDVRKGVTKKTRAKVALASGAFRCLRESPAHALEPVRLARKDFEAQADRRGMADCDHLTGVIHELLCERELALRHLKQALKEHRAVWDRLGEGRDLTALGVLCKNYGRLDKAMDYFTKAMDLRKGVGELRGYAANLANLGNVYKHRKQTAEALKSLEASLEVYRSLSDKKGEADILTNIGNVLDGRGSHGTALERFSAALALHREIQDARGIGADLAGMGALHLARGDLDAADSCLEEARKVNEKIRNPRGELAILMEKAMVERARRRYGTSLNLLKKAQGIASQLKDPRAAASIQLKTAMVLEDSGDYAQALRILQETLGQFRTLRDRQGELWALGSIGIVGVKLGEFETALTNLQDALKLQSELGLSAANSRDLDFYVAEIHERCREYERALEHYHKALDSQQMNGSDVLLGQIQDRIGNIYYRMEEYSRAGEFLEDALRIHTETKNLAMQLSELIRMGDVVSKLGDTNKALGYQERALVLAKETGDEAAEARILTRRGILQQILGRPRKALADYRDAKEKRLRLGDRRGVNENLLQIALVTSILGDFESAVADLKSAFEIAQRSEDRSMLWKAYFVMGRALQEKKRLGEALESYRKAIGILEAMEADIMEESEEDNFIFGGKTALFETTLHVLMGMARKDPDGAYDNQALSIVEKLKATSFENALSRIKVDSFSRLPRDLLAKEKNLRLSIKHINEKITAALSKVGPDQRAIEQMHKERREKEKAFEELKRKLATEYPAYSSLRYPQAVSVPYLQKEVLRPDEAVIEYMVTRSRTYLFAIDRDRFYTYSIPYALKDLQQDVVALMKPLHRADNQASWDPSIACRLYTKLVRPVEAMLKVKKAVVVIPHGPLALVPFEIMVSSKAHEQKRFWSPSDRPRYLLEDYAFCYAPSLTVLSELRQRVRETEPGWNIVAFGDAVYSTPDGFQELNPGAEQLISAVGNAPREPHGSGLRRLHGGRKEISRILKVMGNPSHTYLGKEAAETLFKKADLSRFAYVHLMTHGVLLKSGGKLWPQPAVVFSLYGDKENDGFLQLGEVFGLELAADMVLLSSCQSLDEFDVTSGNWLEGLSRAFLFAGSDSLVLGMWRTNDRISAGLFTDLYRGLKCGSKAEALRQAKLAIMRNPETCHPYYWAPFVLTGNWNVTVKHDFNEVDPEQVRFKGLSTWRKLLSM
ncbi:MAG: tetratricopeptide repeat protein [Thermodesulfobacteriota bacterium]